MKKYALFHLHFYKSISALSRVLYINQFCSKNLYMNARAIFQFKAVPLCKKFFSENFCPVCDCLVQGRRHGGAFRSRAPPSDCLCPPKQKLCPLSEDCAPKKLTGSGLLECKSRPKLVFGTRKFVIFWDLHRISQNFWGEDHFFFWKSPIFGWKTRLNF